MEGVISIDDKTDDNINNIPDNTKQLVFHIVDSPMGSGKSQAIISYANTGNFSVDSRNRLLIVASTKKEQDRFVESCPGFYKPKETPFRESIKKMFKDGKNIVTTHALCELLDGETRDIISNSSYAYILIIDEQPNCIKNIIGARKFYEDGNGKKTDLIEVFSRNDTIIAQRAGLLKLDKATSKVTWVDGCDYEKNDTKAGVFTSFKHCCDIADLYNYGGNLANSDLINTIIALAKKETFAVFASVWICSYMVKGSLLDNYCSLYDISTKYYHVENKQFVDGYKFQFPNGLERLVVEVDRKLAVQEKLSKSCYSKDKYNHVMKKIACKMRYFKEKYGIKKKQMFWTTFKTYKDELITVGKPHLLKSGYLPCNTKATNDYQNYHYVAYLCSRFANPNMVNFMAEHDITFNNDLYALSELIQVIWRSNVRVSNSKDKIIVYVPDERMRELLVDFIHKGVEEKNYMKKAA